MFSCSCIVVLKKNNSISDLAIRANLRFLECHKPSFWFASYLWTVFMRRVTSTVNKTNVDGFCALRTESPESCLLLKPVSLTPFTITWRKWYIFEVFCSHCSHVLTMSYVSPVILDNEHYCLTRKKAYTIVTVKMKICVRKHVMSWFVSFPSDLGHKTN